MLNLGWFSTGRGEGSRGLLRMAIDAISRGELRATIPFVFCNREPGEHAGSDEFMAMVRGYGIPLVTLSSQRFRRERGVRSIGAVRLEFDREAMGLFERFEPDLCVLAGYMLIAGPEMCRRYTMLNLHPALPGGPTGTWQGVIWQLIGEGAARQGAMVHLATEDLDQGPPTTYVSFPTRGGGFDPLWEQVRGLSVEEMRERHGEELPLFQAIRQEGMRRERPLLLETLKAFAEGRLRVEGRRVLGPDGRPVASLCINDEVERALAGAGGSL